MDRDTLLEWFKTTSQAQIVKDAGEFPDVLTALFELVSNDHSTIRYKCTRVIRAVSETRPEAVYPHFDEVVAWLHDSNSFVMWDGIVILADLAAVDADNRFASIYEEYFSLIQAPQMITAANVVSNAWKIIHTKPEWEPDITQKLLTVPDVVYLHHGEQSPECNYVLCGHVLQCFGHYFNQAQNQTAILHFAQKLVDCPRKSVAKKAARFLRQYNN